MTDHNKKCMDDAKKKFRKMMQRVDKAIKDAGMMIAPPEDEGDSPGDGAASLLSFKAHLVREHYVAVADGHAEAAYSMPSRTAHAAPMHEKLAMHRLDRPEISAALSDLKKVPPELGPAGSILDAGPPPPPLASLDAPDTPAAAGPTDAETALDIEFDDAAVDKEAVKLRTSFFLNSKTHVYRKKTMHLSAAQNTVTTMTIAVNVHQQLVHRALYKDLKEVLVVFHGDRDAQSQSRGALYIYI